MKKPTEIYDVFDIVLVPFPFTETPNTKKRPALVISSNKQFNRHSGASIMAMITSATHSPWPLDTHILDLKHAGLPVRSIIRMKLFTLDHHLILKKLGVLSIRDRATFQENFNLLFNI